MPRMVNYFSIISCFLVFFEFKHYLLEFGTFGVYFC